MVEEGIGHLSSLRSLRGPPDLILPEGLLPLKRSLSLSRHPPQRHVFRGFDCLADQIPGLQGERDAVPFCHSLKGRKKRRLQNHVDPGILCWHWIHLQYKCSGSVTPPQAPPSPSPSPPRGEGSEREKRAGRGDR